MLDIRKNPVQYYIHVAEILQAASPGCWYPVVEGRDVDSGSSVIHDFSHKSDEIYLFGDSTEIDYDFAAYLKRDIPLLVNEIIHARQVLDDYADQLPDEEYKVISHAFVAYTQRSVIGLSDYYLDGVRTRWEKSSIGQWNTGAQDDSGKLTVQEVFEKNMLDGANLGDILMIQFGREQIPPLLAEYARLTELSKAAVYPISFLQRSYVTKKVYDELTRYRP